MYLCLHVGLMIHYNTQTMEKYTMFERTTCETPWHITPANFVHTLNDPSLYELKRGKITSDRDELAQKWGFSECVTYEIKDTSLHTVSAIIDIEVTVRDLENLAWATPPAEIVELIWTDEATEDDAIRGTVTLCSDLELKSYNVCIMSPTDVQLTVEYTYHTELYYNC